MIHPSRVFVLAFGFTLLAPSLARADQTSCAADWREHTYFSARDSIVSIETVGVSIEHLENIAGFVYPTRSHVVALTSAASIGRGLVVHFANGREIRANAVAVDEARHVTILKLDEEAPASAVPLHVVDRRLEVGEELVGISPFDGRQGMDAYLHDGHVATAGDRGLLRFDASAPATIGAPIFDCSGDVVALRGYGAIVPARDIVAVQPASRPPDDRHWSALHLNGGFIGQVDDRFRIGASAGMAFVNGDRWQIRLAFGALATVPRPSEERSSDKLSGARLQIEPTVGYRIMLTERFPTYLVPQAGVVGRYDIASKTHVEYTIPDVGCVARGGPCDVEPKVSSTTSSAAALRPALGVSFLIPGAAITYQVHLDPEDPTKSTHQLFVGVEF